VSSLTDPRALNRFRDWPCQRRSPDRPGSAVRTKWKFQSPRSAPGLFAH
jgi:hypothetical protein